MYKVQRTHVKLINGEEHLYYGEEGWKVENTGHGIMATNVNGDAVFWAYSALHQVSTLYVYNQLDTTIPSR